VLELFLATYAIVVEASWNVMAHGDAREGKWRGNWRVEWVASTFHTVLEHGLSSITTADTHTRLPVVDWTDAPCRFIWIRPFRRKTKSGFCASAITFQLASTAWHEPRFENDTWISSYVGIKCQLAIVKFLRFRRVFIPFRVSPFCRVYVKNHMLS